MSLLLAASVWPADEAVLARRRGSDIELVDEQGRVVRRQAWRLGSAVEVALSRDGLRGMALTGRCSDESVSSLFEVSPAEEPARVQLSHLVSSPLDPIEKEVLSDLALSSTGRFAAMALTVCDKVLRDTTPGPGGLVLVDRVAGTHWTITRIAAGGEEGLIPFAHSPSWSDDEQLVAVNFETGFSVLRARDGAGLTASPGFDANSRRAIGWVGSRCVVYQNGKDYEDAARKEPWVLNVTTGQSRRLAEIGWPAEKGLWLVAMRWPHALARDEQGVVEVVVKAKGRFRRHSLGQDSSVNLLPVPALVGSLPLFCR